MYSRLIEPPKQKSFFLLGPRGTGKSSWVRSKFPGALYFDLLEADLYAKLSARPQRLEDLIPSRHKDWIILDEIQKIPEILDEVHRLIEKRKLKFILTGSSARKLKKKGVNLLAGRALSYFMHPLTSHELGKDFDLKHSLRFGGLPSVYVENDPRRYLQTYISTYLKEEVQQEGLTRNLGAFARFLEAATFSQGSVLNISKVAEECSVERKVVEQYFIILEDLLIASRIPIFSKRAKRKLVAHSKFFFFDSGVFRTLRPKGPLDSDAEIQGPALETLVWQETRALNDYLDLEYQIYFWRTLLKPQREVDFVLYGPRGLLALEVKAGSHLSREDFTGLKAFQVDYPMANCFLIYTGTRSYFESNIRVLPIDEFLKHSIEILKRPQDQV